MEKRTEYLYIRLGRPIARRLLRRGCRVGGRTGRAGGWTRDRLDQRKQPLARFLVAAARTLHQPGEMFGRVAARFQQPLFEQILRQVVRLHVLLDVRPVLGMLAAGHDLEQRPEVGKVELHQRPAPGGALFRVRKAAEQKGGE
uniref:Uncharacterized protein n=1 Tax=Anopheles melas TaxID=34690 RepID=A0A182TLE1_9DIPT